MLKDGIGAIAKGKVRPKKAKGPVVSVSDPETVLMKGRHGYVVGFNGQAVADGKAQVIVASDVVADATDVRHLESMLDEVEEMTGRQPEAMLADGGYHSANNLQALPERSVDLYMPDPQLGRKSSPDQWPYHKEHLAYHAATDTYVCPQGKCLTFSHLEHRAHGKRQETRVYQCHDCEGCPGWGTGGCTKSEKGRRIKTSGHEESLRRHRQKMKTEEARELSKKRSGIVEPVFAVIKEHMGLTRLLLRGLEDVRGRMALPLCGVQSSQDMEVLVASQSAGCGHALPSQEGEKGGMRRENGPSGWIQGAERPRR